MKITLYCICGSKLEREAADEDAARLVAREFWKAHAGAELRDGRYVRHGSTDFRGHCRVLSRMIASKHHQKENRKRGHELPELPLLEYHKPEAAEGQTLRRYTIRRGKA